MKTPKRTIRNRVKQQAVANAMRARIVAGRWQPGERLPVRQKLMQALSASSITVQRACDDLVAEGFLTTQARAGTFVHTHPPHRFAYGIVFNEGPTGFMGGLRKQAFEHAAAALAHRYPHRCFKSFPNVLPYAGTEGRNRLNAAVEKHLVAGLVFLHQPQALQGTPALNAPDLPRAAFGSVSEPSDVFAIHTEGAPFMVQAAAHLRARSIARAGIILPVRIKTQPATLPGEMVRCLEAAGIQTHPCWVLGLGYDSQPCNFNLLRLFARLPEAERPEALVVIDDNLTADLVVGLRQAGIAVPEQLQIVSVANYPVPPPVEAVTLIGQDFVAGLEKAVALIDECNQDPERAGELSRSIELPWVIQA